MIGIRQRQNIFKGFLLFFIACSSFHVVAKKPIEKIDNIYLYPSLPLSYRLPDKLRDKKLVFTGNYKKNTGAVHRRDRYDILFTPTRVGDSVLVVRDSKKQILTRLIISVKKDNLHKIAAEIRELLIAVDGIEIKIYNDMVLVDGQVLLPIEMDRVQKIVSSYNPNLVKSFVSYSPLAQKKIAELVEKEMAAPQLSVRYAYNRFLIEGCVNTAAERDRALRIANLYTQYEVNPVGKGAAKKQVSPLEYDIKVPCESAKKKQADKKKKEEIKKLIQIVVHFVEMSKQFEKGFFFQWTPAITDNKSQVSASFNNNRTRFLPILTATINNFFPKLNWAKSFNFARVLHNSSLLMEEGVKGVISSKENLPPVTNKEGESSEGGVSAGVTVEVVPKIQGSRDLGAGRSIIQIQTNISVTSTLGSKANTKAITTAINVRDGASAVIGGLTSSFLSRKYDDPFPLDKGGVPILNLYTGKKYTATKTQFIVFLTPLIKSSASGGVDRIKKRFKVDE